MKHIILLLMDFGYENWVQKYVKNHNFLNYYI